MSNTRIKVVQHVLGLTIDGISGPRTIQAIKNFQSNNKLVPDGLVGNKTISAMSDKILELEAKNIDTELFYIELRKSGLFKSLTQSRVNGINTILSVIKSNSITEQSYMLATIYHECATTMLPISEYGKGKNYVYGRWMNNSLGELVCYCNGNKRTIYKKSECDNLFYGRGYVQLTWYDNYLKAGRSLGIDLLNHPDLALDPSNAAKIMLYGMTYGWFTGRKNSDYLRLDDADYDNARRIINGKDNSKLIASYADTFETIIRRSVV